MYIKAPGAGFKMNTQNNSKRKAASSKLEDKFRDLWAELGYEPLVEQFKFCDTRRWRADFAHIGSKILIEIEGGVFNRGRHVSPKGFIADCEKYNTALYLGYKVVRLVPMMINTEELKKIYNLINEN